MPRGVVLPLDLPVRPGKTSALLVMLAFAQFGQFLHLLRGYWHPNREIGIRPNSVFPLETRTFEEKQIFQEEQKTICAIIKPVLGIFF